MRVRPPPWASPTSPRLQIQMTADHADPARGSTVVIDALSARLREDADVPADARPPSFPEWIAAGLANRPLIPIAAAYASGILAIEHAFFIPALVVIAVYLFTRRSRALAGLLAVLAIL